MGIDLCQGRRIDFIRIDESTLRVKAIDCNVGESTRRQNDQFVVVQSEQGKKGKKGLNGTPLHDNDLHHLALVLFQRKLVKYQFSSKILLNSKQGAHSSFY